MTGSHRYYQLDVFSEQLLKGNPLAVVLDASGLHSSTMQAIARWTNLSETSFLLPPTRPDADYRVRIFTPRQELPFAGHPSVGSAYVAIEAGLIEDGRSEFMQECAAGLLPVRVEGRGPARRIHVQAPAAHVHDIDPVSSAALGHALGHPLDATAVHRVDNGPRWLICDLHEDVAVRSLDPDLARLARLCLEQAVVGVSVFGASSEPGLAMAVRAFCPADSVPEDPVTGSANAAIAAALLWRGELDRYGCRYRASQGREVGRDGIVDVSVAPATATITIGGACAPGVRGMLSLQQ
jgi:PhzF family phenazine biosynthesis protein